MRRGELVAALAVVLGGCMRIYPDPELPDVEVTWFEDDCRPGTGDIIMTLIGVDAESRTVVTAPCSDLKATFVDVARERYQFVAFLQDADGEAFSRYDNRIDLRDGIDERLDLYFGAYSNFRVAWAFDMGATCESVGADGMLLTFSSPDTSIAFQDYAVCAQTPFFGQFPDGTYTMHLEAVDGMLSRARSAESDEFEIIDPELTDLGTVTLSP